jgi:type IV pilus assembly protein PilV
MRTHHPSHRPAHAQRGVSLIELLVALLIFSFGMLGLAGLQLRTLSYSQSSLFRSQAVALTDDVLDRMRASRTDASIPTSGGWNSDFDEAGANGSDLADWKAEVASLLPGGEASIAVTSTNVTIVIRWLDSPDKNREELTSFQTVTAL